MTTRKTLVHVYGSVEQPPANDDQSRVLQLGAACRHAQLPRAGKVQTGRLEAFVASSVRMRVNTGVLISTDGAVVRGTDRFSTDDAVVRGTDRGKMAEYPNGASVESLFAADEQVFVAYNAGWRNYYHFLLESAFSTWVLTKLFAASDGKFIFPPLPANHARILGLCGVPAERAVFLERKTILDLSKVVCVDSTYFRFPSTLLAEFARDLRVQAEASTGKGRRIYVSRRDSQRRRITNENEVEDYFLRRGFEIVVLSALSFREQIGTFASADVVVAPHGAGLANTIFCAPDVKIVELMSDAYVNRCFLNLSRALGLDHTLAVFCGSGCGDGARHWESWSIEIKEIDSVLGPAGCL